MSTAKQPANHFYASSVAMWATTTPERDLRQLIELMDSDGYPYNLFFIPHPHDTPYDIKFYQPQIEGAVWVGFFETKERGKTKRTPMRFRVTA